MLASIVITNLNEEETLNEFIKRVKEAFSRTEHDFELVFIDDDSKDRSVEIIKSHIDNDKRIKLISMSRRFGRQACYFAGFKVCKGDVGVMMDSDLQDPVELIPDLIEKLVETKSDVVYTVMKSRKGETAFKLFLTKISYFILNKICYIPMPENAGQFKVFNRKVINVINEVKENDIYFKGLINWIALKQVPFEFERDARFAGETQHSLWGLKPYRDMFLAITSFSNTPLYLMFIIAVSFFLFCFVALVFHFFRNGVSQIMSVVDNLNTLVILMSLSLVMLFLGVISLYLRHIHTNTSNRPRYVIKEEYGDF